MLLRRGGLSQHLWRGIDAVHMLQQSTQRSVSAALGRMPVDIGRST